MDYSIKLFKYRSAGVREYWIVDPEKSRIMVHDLMNEDITEYTFHDSVKSKIYENLIDVYKRQETMLAGKSGYCQFEYVKKELKHLFACADVIISRAGANAICELLALRKPNILIPLGLNASRGDQILNAQSFQRQGYSYVLNEEEVTSKSLLNAVHEVYENRASYINAMNQSELSDPIGTIVKLANELSVK